MFTNAFGFFGGGGALTPVASFKFSGGPDVEIKNLKPDKFDTYWILLSDIRISSNTLPRFNVSIDNGATWEDFNDYDFVNWMKRDDLSGEVIDSTPTGDIPIFPTSLTFDSAQSGSLELWFFNPNKSSTLNTPLFRWHGTAGHTTNARSQYFEGGAAYNSNAGTVDALRLHLLVGQFDNVDVRVYGLQKDKGINDPNPSSKNTRQALQLIRTEVFSGSTTVEFDGGATGSDMNNNAPEAFNGTYDRLWLTCPELIKTSNTVPHIQFLTNGIWNQPNYKYITSGRRTSDPATLKTVNVGPSQWPVHPGLFSIIAGHSSAFIGQIDIGQVFAGEKPSRRGTLRMVGYEGVGGELIVGNSMTRAIDSLAVVDGIRLQPVFGTLSGKLQLWGLSKI